MARYSNETKNQALALYNAGVSIDDIVVEFGGKPARRTIRYWVTEAQERGELVLQTEKTIDLEQAVENIVGRMAGLVNAKIDQLMSDPDALASTPLHHITTAYGISFDKHQLLTGGATERTESRDLVVNINHVD
jgi:transposase-like protein